METVNIKDVPLDIRQQKFVSVGDFYQNDTNIIKFTLSDNNNPADLSNVDEILINYKRPDGEIISRLLEAESNIINYQLGQSEMQVAGLGKLVLQFFRNDKRLSTFVVNVSVKKSIETNFEFEEGENPLADQLFERINTLINRIEILESIINDGTPPITNTSPNITSTFNLTSVNDSTSIAIPYVISDAQGGNMTSTYTKNGVVTTANVNVGANTWNVGTLSVGNHVLKIKVTDSGGLTSNELTFNLTVIQTETEIPNPPIEENLIYTWVGAVM